MIIFIDENIENKICLLAEDFISSEECKKIIEIAKNKNLEKAKINSNQKNVRDSNICWLDQNDDLNWLFTKIANTCLELNKSYFKFDLTGIIESLQFTNYKAPFGNYGKHIDFGGTRAPVRKLSISIQLTNPEEYEGGELVLYGSEKPNVMNKKQGTLILFPSYILHEVKPVTKGERNSLVCWITGKPFR